jgi:spermidine/putrescine transport system substrate-binding protein
VLIYNTALVDEEPTSWKELWDEKYRDKVLMFNNSRDAFAIAQAVLGQDFNTTDEQDWIEAAELLAQQKDAVNPVYVMDEVFNLMESGEYAFATYYGGDYELMVENNEDLAYCFPEEGVNIFYDAFCIPTCAQNTVGAEAFIYFMHEPQVAFENTVYIFFACPNIEVMNDEESSVYGSEAVYPEELPNPLYFENLPQNILELQATLWTSVKSGSLSVESKNKDKRIYIEFSVLVGIAAVGICVKLISNKRKSKFEDLSEIYGK